MRIVPSKRDDGQSAWRPLLGRPPSALGEGLGERDDQASVWDACSEIRWYIVLAANPGRGSGRWVLLRHIVIFSLFLVSLASLHIRGTLVYPRLRPDRDPRHLAFPSALSLGPVTHILAFLA